LFLSSSLTFPSSAGVSPNIFTKPPKGIALRVYFVPFFSQKVRILGGNQIPNSSTLIPAFLATIKCPHS